MKTKKILFVQLGRIGDLILMTPMFKVLKEANPDNEIHLLAGQHNYLLAIEHPLIDNVHVYDKSFVSSVRLIKKLRKAKFDYWIDAKDHYSTESYYFAKLSNAEIKVGFNRNGNSVFDHSILSDAQQKNKHAVERNLAAINFLGVNLEHKIISPTLFVNSDSESKLNNFLKQHDIQDFYCINISATSASRYWQLEKWANFLNYLSERQIKSVIISAPYDLSLVEAIIASTDNAFHFTTKTIVDVFSVVKHSKMTITPDTSVVHIAAAFNVPVIALYKNHPVNYTKFRPLSTNYRMVIDPQSNASLGNISVDLVIERYNELIKEIDSA